MTQSSSRPAHAAAGTLGYRTMEHGVFTTLRTWILTGRLEPGQRLRIRELAAELGVSTMPVREALRRLESVGLVSSVPHHGATVIGLTLRDLHDFYGVRLLLEPEAARLGAQAVGPDQLAELRRLADALGDAVARKDTDAILDLDDALLAIVYRAAGNDFLLELVRSLWDRVKPYKLLYMATAASDAGQQVLRADRALVDACERADGAAAHATLQAWLQDALAALARVLHDHQRHHTSQEDQTP